MTITALTSFSVPNKGGEGIDDTEDYQASCRRFLNSLSTFRTEIALFNTEVQAEYETGTFSPIFTDNSLSADATMHEDSIGIYKRIEDFVWFALYGKATDMTGLGTTLAIRGLPFVAANDNDYDPALEIVATGLSQDAGVKANGRVFDGTSYIRPYEWDISVGVSNFLTSKIVTTEGSESELYITGTYTITW